MLRGVSTMPTAAVIGPGDTTPSPSTRLRSIPVRAIMASISRTMRATTSAGLSEPAPGLRHRVTIALPRLDTT